MGIRKIIAGILTVIIILSGFMGKNGKYTDLSCITEDAPNSAINLAEDNMVEAPIFEQVFAALERNFPAKNTYLNTFGW